MIIFLFLCILFFVSTVYNFAVSDYTDAYIAIIFFVVFLALYMYFRNQKKRAESFLHFLLCNEKEIQSGLATYNGHLIASNTILTQYSLCISLVFFSVILKSKFIVKKSLMSVITNIIYTCFTVLLGWWSLPRGPFRAVKTIGKNLSGGSKYYVKDLIAVLNDKREEHEYNFG